MFWRQVVASQVEEESSQQAFLGRQLALFGEGFSFSGYERDLLMLNRGDGTFVNASGASGIDSVGDGRAAVFADFDNDGDTDVFLRSMHAAGHLLFKNEVGREHGYVRVALQGKESGRDAYGAVVRVKTSAGTQTRVKSGGAGFLAQADPRLLFGLGGDARAESIEISWPSGRKQAFAGPATGTSWLVVEGEDPVVVDERRFDLPAPAAPGDAAWKATKLAKGKPFPSLALTEPGGAAAPAAALTAEADGRLTLVNFWATWCVPCAKEMPELQRLSKEEAVSLRVVGLSVDDATTRSKVSAHARLLGVDYPVFIVEPDSLSDVYASGDVVVPLSVLLDERGRVVDVFTGWSRATARRLRAAVSGQ